MNETTLMQRIRLRATKLGYRMFRNNVAMAYVGKPIFDTWKRSWTVYDARPIHFGLAKGSSDLIGIRSIVITQDMVGKTFGQFLAWEIKMPEGRVTPEQNAFLDMVMEFGGDARVVRFEEQISESTPDDKPPIDVCA